MKTLREIQTSLPWTIRYSRDYRANPQTHKDFAHAIVHVHKAAGKLSALVDDMDHDREIADDPTLRERYGKYLADLVVCALRAANTFPGGVVDLQAAVEGRITEKNGPAVNVAPEPMRERSSERSPFANPDQCGVRVPGGAVYCTELRGHAGPHWCRPWGKVWDNPAPPK